MSGIIGGGFNGNSGVVGQQEGTNHFFEASLSGTQSMADGSEPTVEFNTIATGMNPDGWFDTSSYRYTPKKAGKYLIGINGLGWSTSGVGYLNVASPRIRKNGSTFVTTYADLRNGNAGYVLPIHITALIDFNGSSDYVDFKVFIQTSGSSSYSLATCSSFGHYISS